MSNTAQDRNRLRKQDIKVLKKHRRRLRKTCKSSDALILNLESPLNLLFELSTTQEVLASTIILRKGLNKVLIGIHEKLTLLRESYEATE